MKRRAFITLLGSAAAWPLVARAQQPTRMPRIGVLANLPENDPDGRSRHAALLEELHQLGWTEGRNVQIDYRFALGNIARLRQYAAELVALAPDVILATGQEATGALQQVTRTVPIVFVLVPDPVGAGFVDSLAHPGGNVTGFTPWEYGFSAKWLELLKEIAPGVFSRARSQLTCRCSRPRRSSCTLTSRRPRRLASPSHCRYPAAQTS